MRKTSKDYFQVLKERKKKPLFTREQVLAEEIWLFFSKKIPFPAIMKIIHEKGHQAVYEIFHEVKKAKFPNKPALFLSLIKKEKIIWLEDKNSRIKKKNQCPNSF